MLGKSEENEKVAQLCQENGCFNAGASRAYYSAFQLLKGLLTKGNFDYKSYMQGKSTDKQDYSHGTIRGAFVEFVESKFPDSKERKKCIEALKLYLKSLYLTRTKADYNEETVTASEMRISLNQLRHIRESIDNLWNTTKSC